MSRDDLPRARSLVRLRDITLDAAMRVLMAATAALTEADAAVADAITNRDAEAVNLTATLHALTENPADAARGLARIAVARERVAAAVVAIEVAEQARREAEDAVIAARAAARRANARRDAMAEQATRLRRSQARLAEERAAIESEEGAAAMRMTTWQ